MNLDAVVVPDNYKGFYNINTYHKQLLIGNNEYLDKKEMKDYMENVASKKGTSSGSITNTDYNMPTNTFELNKKLIDFNNIPDKYKLCIVHKFKQLLN